MIKFHLTYHASKFMKLHTCPAYDFLSQTFIILHTFPEIYFLALDSIGITSLSRIGTYFRVALLLNPTAFNSTFLNSLGIIPN